jgi:hypothetical protein
VKEPKPGRARRLSDVFAFIFETLPAIIVLLVLVVLTILYGLARLIF